MGGSIGVDTTPGKGSSFYFTLPARAVTEGAVPQFQPARDLLSGRTVLIAEGNVRSRDALQRELEAWGMTVIAAGSGQAVKDALGGGRPIDLAIVGGPLPDIDGGTLERALGEDAASRAAPVALLMLTHDVAESAPSLFGAKLLKPVRQVQLHEAVVAAMGGAARPSARANAPPARRDAGDAISDARAGGG